MNGVAHATGGTGDHLHVLMGLTQNHTLADVMRDLKADSSKWIKGELGYAGFGWQEGYGAFTVSPPEVEKVRKYVLNQEEHHRKKTFQDEYIEMLKRGLVEFDDRYLW
jgi:REP element-mobilizing transposase RayT